MCKMVGFVSQTRRLELNRRIDNLGTQVDVGLKTLSNTNRVLNKLVDRLIAVYEQLDQIGLGGHSTCNTYR